MPIINLKMGIGRTVEQKRELAVSLTRETARILGLAPERITVVIEELPRENWATGGQTLLDLYGPVKAAE